MRRPVADRLRVLCLERLDATDPVSRSAVLKLRSSLVDLWLLLLDLEQFDIASMFSVLLCLDATDIVSFRWGAASATLRFDLWLRRELTAIESPLVLTETEFLPLSDRLPFEVTSLDALLLGPLAFRLSSGASSEL